MSAPATDGVPRSDVLGWFRADLQRLGIHPVSLGVYERLVGRAAAGDRGGQLIWALTGLRADFYALGVHPESLAVFDRLLTRP